MLSNAEFAAMRDYMGGTACAVDCTFPVAEGEAGLRAAIERIRREAEEGVRAGCTHVILTDEHQGPERAPIPMILATGGVHTHLVRQTLRTFTSLNVRAAECMDVHYFAVLIGVGATTVNAYLAQESIADRHRRGLFGDIALKTAVAALQEGGGQGAAEGDVEDGHLASSRSYRGGYNFEAIGLSRALVAEFFPACSRASPASACPASRARCWSCTTPPGTPMRSRCRSAASTSCAGAARRTPSTAKLIHTLQAAVATDSYTTYRALCGRGAAACRRSRCATCSTSAPSAARRSRSTRSRASPRSASAWSRPASRSARSAPRRTRRCRSR